MYQIWPRYYHSFQDILFAINLVHSLPEKTTYKNPDQHFSFQISLIPGCTKIMYHFSRQKSIGKYGGKILNFFQKKLTLKSSEK